MHGQRVGLLPEGLDGASRGNINSQNPNNEKEGENASTRPLAEDETAGGSMPTASEKHLDGAQGGGLLFMLRS